jgi:putative sugar O-methyltransferase
MTSFLKNTQMNFMKREDEFYRNFKISLNNYKNFFQSDHWLFNNKKKIKLFISKNLKEFRKNGLSYGLDDQFYNKKETNKLFNILREQYGKKALNALLEKKNIGNPKSFVKKDNFFFTGNELVHIKHLLDFRDNISLPKKNIVCEIGSGYGSLISKIIKTYKSKVILIDLPESNFLSHYYLKMIFPKKKFFVSSQIKNRLTKEQIINNDIIILCPWDKIPKIKIDFFINSRSMMEMTYETIRHYFNLIKGNLKIGGYFLCINRYYKDTVGYPIELIKYPFGNNWQVLISKKSWLQDHIHYFFLKKSKNSLKDIHNEMEKINIFSIEVKKKDQFFLRRILPTLIYKIYKVSKYRVLKYFNGI